MPMNDSRPRIADPRERGTNPSNKSDVITVIEGNAKKLKTNTALPLVKQGAYLKRDHLKWPRTPLFGNPALK